jgi:hypothetical protein
MPAREVIREYLVSLGAVVDEVTMRKLEDSLKRTGIVAEKFAKNMSIGFAAAAGAVTTAFAAVGAGVTALAVSTARQDLQFQLFARRMFMGETAARKMKIALDALGYSMEEIIWGPPELAERYRQLIADQTNMIKVMGGETGERAFRKIRDIEFQFTRMGPELIMFSRKFTEDLVVKMFGSLDNFENKLKHLNDWFQANIPMIADKITGVLVPAFQKVGSILGWVWDKTVAVGKYFEQWGENAGILSPTYNRDYFRAHAHGGLEPLGPGTPEQRAYASSGMSSIDSLIAKSPGATKFSNWLNSILGIDNPTAVRELITQTANKYGIDPRALMAIAQKESGMNPNAPLGSKGEIGMMQIMPSTGAKEGYDIDQLWQLGPNVSAGAQRLKEGLEKFGGDYKRAFEYYNGSGPQARAYAEDVWRKYQAEIGNPTIQPQSYSATEPNVHIEKIEINGTNLSKDELKDAIKNGITDYVKTSSQRMMAQRQGSYA